MNVWHDLLTVLRLPTLRLPTLTCGSRKATSRVLLSVLTGPNAASRMSGVRRCVSWKSKGPAAILRDLAHSEDAGLDEGFHDTS